MRLAIGVQRFRQTTRGRQDDSEGVVEYGRLAMNTTGERDALGNSAFHGGYRTIDITGSALLSRANPEPLQALLRILVGGARPEGLRLCQQLPRMLDMSAGNLDVGKLLLRIGHVARIEPRIGLREVALQQCGAACHI